MQPQNNPQSGFNLPPVAPEQLPPVVPIEAAPGMPEMAPSAAEFAPNAAAGAAPATAQPMPLLPPTQSSAPLNPVVPQTTPTAAPITTDDGDLIEKVWVSKAKNIVESTKDDPYQQSKQLSHLKADYLQKRYSKEIKQGE
jgi:hypothetical protein